MAISAARARQICTKAELELVQQSNTKNIGSLSATQLKSLVRRARTQRDKWRDQSHAQNRSTKVTDPAKLEEANRRSAEKATLFDEALGRFEKRLAKVEAAGEKAKRQPAGTAKKAESTVNHRADRAAVRSVLLAKTESLNEASTPSKSPSKAAKKTSKRAAKKVAKKAASSTTGKSAKAAPTKSATKSATKSKTAKRSVSASRTKKAVARKVSKRSQTLAASTPGTAGQSSGLMAAKLAAGELPAKGKQRSKTNKSRNMKAKTSAKADAIARSGAPRIQGHVSAQGRKNQAKRNAN